MLEEWAEREVELACKKEVSDLKDGEWDYGCACYKSALKAYKSLLKDEHSGASWNITVSILNRLCKGIPLTPITEEDFNVTLNKCESLKWLSERGLKSSSQCQRMSSLFRYEHLDGTVTYTDLNRDICCSPDYRSSFHCGLASDILDEMFPITLPYSGTPTPYKIIVEDFVVDPRNGDYDTIGILRIETPDGKNIKVDRYFDVSNGRREISAEEYYNRRCWQNKYGG